MVKLNPSIPAGIASHVLLSVREMLDEIVQDMGLPSVRNFVSADKGFIANYVSWSREDELQKISNWENQLNNAANLLNELAVLPDPNFYSLSGWDPSRLEKLPEINAKLNLEILETNKGFASQYSSNAELYSELIALHFLLASIKLYGFCKTNSSIVRRSPFQLIHCASRFQYLMEIVKDVGEQSEMPDGFVVIIDSYHDTLSKLCKEAFGADLPTMAANTRKTDNVFLELHDRYKTFYNCVCATQAS